MFLFKRKLAEINRKIRNLLSSQFFIKSSSSQKNTFNANHQRYKPFRVINSLNTPIYAILLTELATVIILNLYLTQILFHWYIL